MLWSISFLLLQQAPFLTSLVCPSRNAALDVARKGIFCSASSSFQHMPCQYAWDGDRSTIWHPSGSGQGDYTSLHLDQAVILHGINIEQFLWSSGFASNI